MSRSGMALALGAGVVLASLSWAGTEPAARPKAGSTPPRDYPVRPVPFTAVHLDDAFWAPRIEINRKVTIPFAFEKAEESQRVHHFERAAAILRGEARRVSEVEVYWFDDAEEGESRLPSSWRVLYRDGEQWKPVEAAGPYPVGKDAFVKASFAPVETSGLRLEVALQPEMSAGILEWKAR